MFGLEFILRLAVWKRVVVVRVAGFLARCVCFVCCCFYPCLCGKTFCVLLGFGRLAVDKLVA